MRLTTTGSTLLVFVVATLPAPSGVLAQDDAPATDTNDGEEESRQADLEPDPPDRTSPDPRDERIAKLERKLEEQQQSFDERITAIEETQEEQMLAGMPGGFEPSFDVYGFFDLTFNKFFPKEDGFFDGVLHDDASFFVQNLNVYLKSQMTESLSAIAEIGFTFAPTGQERSIEVEGYSDFERAQTTITSPFDSEETRLGGLTIERVHLTWRPSEYFGVIAGRYLTPFGIWNIEHGSPVLISIRPPLMQTNHFVPQAQTGLQVFGDFHPRPGHMIKYAITISNGRGPMDEVYDLDANMAGGIRLRYVYDSPEARLALGGYGYTGQYTDKHHRIVSFTPIDMEFYVNESYREWIGTLDALVETHGLRLQIEYARRLVTYDERPLRSPEDGGGYPPDYVGQGAFAMLAYTLPLEKYIGSFGITPYVSGDHLKINDVDDYWGCTLVAGLNLRPSPFVAIKAEYYYTIFPEWHAEEVAMGTRDEPEESFWGIAAQLAVSF